MCLIFAVLGQHPDFPVIIAANRDEFYDRPARPADFWAEHPELLAGRDELAGGTWLGITRQGRFAAVTNVREPRPGTRPSSRGHIVSSWLQSDRQPADFGKALQQNSHTYAGFNCLYGKLNQPAELFYTSNHNSGGISPLGTGIFGLSNAGLDSSWPKILRGKEYIRSLLNKPWSSETWLGMLADTEPAPDHALPDTGVGLDKERMLSPMFIRSPGYGTRCSTLITVSRQNEAEFVEKTYCPSGNTTLRQFTVRITP